MPLPRAGVQGGLRPPCPAQGQSPRERDRRHLARLKSRLDATLAAALKALHRVGLQVQPCGAGGYYLWVRLPGSVQELELVRQAAAQGIFLSPGSVFYPDRRGDHPAMRVNVAYALDPRFLRFMQQAGR